MRLPLRRPDTWLPSQLRDNHLRFFNCHAVQKKAVPEERLRVRSERLVRPESTPHQLTARVQESNAQIGLATASSAGASLATAFFAGAFLASASSKGASLRTPFSAGAFLATTFFTGAFLTTAFFAGAFLTTAFFAEAFLTTAFFAEAFLAGAFLTTAFFAGAFLTTAFFAGAFFAGAFFAGASLAGVFSTASFFAATFFVALAIACPTVSSTTFWLTPLPTAFLTAVSIFLTAFSRLRSSLVMMRSLGRPSALQLGILHRDSVPSPQIRFAQPCAPCLSLSETTGLNQERSLSLFLQVSEGLVADSSPTVAGACLGPWDGRRPGYGRNDGQTPAIRRPA